MAAARARRHGQTSPCPVAQSATQLVLTTRLRVGDFVTEADTPAGPFYRVLEVSPSSLTLDAASDDDDPVPLRLPTRRTDTVLRLV